MNRKPRAAHAATAGSSAAARLPLAALLVALLAEMKEIILLSALRRQGRQNTAGFSKHHRVLD